MSRIKLWFVACFIFSCASIIAGDSISTMAQIEQNTGQTADNTTKGTFDYAAISISIIALIVASVTLYYSWRTKELQEKTERNTRRISLKHERTTLRQMSWKLLKAYNNLITIEAIINEGLSPATVNFKRMLIDLSLLHIYDSFDYEIDSKGTHLLYQLHTLITTYNSQLIRRCDQAEYLTIKNNHNVDGYRLSDFQDSLYSESKFRRKICDNSKHVYFSEEKESIKCILKIVDELYPLLFSPGEDKYDDLSDRKIEIVKNSNSIYDYIQNIGVIPYSENYVCRSGITLDSCKSILNIDDADKYFSLLFVYYYNRVCDNLERLSINEDVVLNNNGLLKQGADTTNEKHRLPVIGSYIDKVLDLISCEVGSHYTLENRDIFLIQNKKEEPQNIEKRNVSVEYKNFISKENLVDVYDPVSLTLYLYVDKKHFEGIVSRKLLFYNYYIEERNLPLFFKHDNGRILCDGNMQIKSFKDGIDYQNKEKIMPYQKNDIQFLTLTYLANGCNDSVTLKINKVKFSPLKDELKYKATITLGEIIKFVRK